MIAIERDLQGTWQRTYASILYYVTIALLLLDNKRKHKFRLSMIVYKKISDMWTPWTVAQYGKIRARIR